MRTTSGTCRRRSRRGRARPRRGRSSPLPTNAAAQRSVGRVVDLLRRARLDDAAVVHQGHAVGERERFLAIVGHEHDRDAERRAGCPPSSSRISPRSSGSMLLHGSSSRITAGPGASDTGERDPLLLSAGELVRVAPPKPASPTSSSTSLTRSARSLRGRPKPTFRRPSGAGTARSPGTPSRRRADRVAPTSPRRPRACRSMRDRAGVRLLEARDRRSSVVLPQPLGPRSARNLAATDRELVDGDGDGQPRTACAIRLSRSSGRERRSP